MHHNAIACSKRQSPGTEVTSGSMPTAIQGGAGCQVFGLGHCKRTLPARRWFAQVLPDKRRESVHR